MKCYYNVLGVPRVASENDIKAAYHRLALKWHPDKNPDNLDGAKKQFQAIQQAYDVLSDVQERAWYDNHREQILRAKNSDYEENCFNIFEYFTASCYNGYEDNANGFYAVYRKVFERIAAEDMEFMDKESNIEVIPEFGQADSSYEEVVRPFYAYWTSYCTKKSFSWLNKYDSTEIKERRVWREIVKEQKKIVQKAKKKRNEEVRSLVAFVRKRDKRIQAYKLLLEERVQQNRNKQKQLRLERLDKRWSEWKEMLSNLEQTEQGTAFTDCYEEQLQELEQQYMMEKDNDVCEGDNECSEMMNEIEEEEKGGGAVVIQSQKLERFTCVTCNKDFKSALALEKHEASKKHRVNVANLRRAVQQQQYLHQQRVREVAILTARLRQRAMDARYPANDLWLYSDEQNSSEDERPHPLNIGAVMSKTRRKKVIRELRKQSAAGKLNGQLTMNRLNNKLEEYLDLVERTKFRNVGVVDIHNEGDDEDIWNGRSINRKGKYCRNRTHSTIMACPCCQENIDSLVCVCCRQFIETKGKLFAHMKATGHGLYVPSIEGYKLDHYWEMVNNQN